MAEVGLTAEVREARGKGAARKLRARGKVPATLYGRGIEPVTLEVDARALGHTLSTDAGANVLIDLQVNGESHLTLAREIDRNPLRGDILHVDFLKISHDQKITVEVPVHFDGEAPGVKEGGVLEHHLWQLAVECLPTNVPDSISVDITGLGVGEAIRVEQVTAPEDVTILTDAAEIIVSCVVPQLRLEAELEEAEAVPEGAEAAEVAEAAPAAEVEGGEATEES